MDRVDRKQAKSPANKTPYWGECRFHRSRALIPSINGSIILNLHMLAISEIPILNSLIFQIPFTVVVSGLFFWQAFQALNEVKDK